MVLHFHEHSKNISLSPLKVSLSSIIIFFFAIKMQKVKTGKLFLCLKWQDNTRIRRPQMAWAVKIVARKMVLFWHFWRVIRIYCLIVKNQQSALHCTICLMHSYYKIFSSYPLCCPSSMYLVALPRHKIDKN